MTTNDNQEWAMFIDGDKEESRKFKEAGFASLPEWNRNERRLVLHFADGVSKAADLSPDGGALFKCREIPGEWEQHGVRDAWVESAMNKSTIHIVMKDRTLICTKHY